MQELSKENKLINDNSIILYHASKNGVCGIIKPDSYAECDFGKGFYMSVTADSVKPILCNKKMQNYIHLSLIYRD